MERNEILSKIKAGFAEKVDTLSDDILNQIVEGKLAIGLQENIGDESGGRAMPERRPQQGSAGSGAPFALFEF